MQLSLVGSYEHATSTGEQLPGVTPEAAGVREQRWISLMTSEPRLVVADAAMATVPLSHETSSVVSSLPAQMPVRPSTAATAGPSVHAFCRSATFAVLFWNPILWYGRPVPYICLNLGLAFLVFLPTRSFKVIMPVYGFNDVPQHWLGFV